MAQVFLSLTGIYFLFCCVGLISGKGSPMKKLRADLLRDYDKYVRPVQNNRNVTSISLSFVPTRLVKVDESKSEITFDGWLSMSWIDEFLTWNPNDFDGLTQINMPIDDMWQADVSPYNGKRVVNDEQQEKYALVYSNGQVIFVPSGRFVTQCNFLSKKYPKTTHTCSLLFGSWTFSGYAVDLQVNETNLSNLANDNPYWEVTKVTSERRLKYYPCCTEPYPSILVNMTLQQRTTVYHYLSKMLRVSSQILFLCMFWLPVAQKMLIGGFAIFCCTAYAVHTAWASHALHPVNLSPVIAQFAVGLAAVIVQIVVINLRQPSKANHPKILNILMTGVGKALSFVQSQPKEPLTSNGVMEPPCSKNEESKNEKHFCKPDSLFFSALLDRILFVIFAVIFLVVGNYC